MTVIRAEVLGMCFGVRDALAALESHPDPPSATIHGQLVHNPVVVQDLLVRGFRTTEEDDRAAIPPTETVVITAHGVSDRERRRLADAGKRLVDTTCPLVRRAHAQAVKLAARVDHVLLIGRPGHVEVIGLAEDLPSVTVVPSVEAVRTYPFARLGIVCQTTTPPAVAEAVRARIVACNPESSVEFVNTVCAPTRDHQRSLESLLGRVEAVVVVGGESSNNTRALAELAKSRGVRAVRVAGPAELDRAWFDGVTTVGLTAGTSTLAGTVDAVEAWLIRA